VALSFLPFVWATDSRPAEIMQLADTLRALYAVPQGPGERWRHRRWVELPDGTRVERERAYRDHQHFIPAATTLLASGRGDDSPLGAWLLGTISLEKAGEVEPILRGALAHSDPRTAFEAARALASIGGRDSVPALLGVSRTAPSETIRAAASWAAEHINVRVRRSAGNLRIPGRLPSAFRRGVSWWHEERGQDGGVSSFEMLASLGVEWVSIHTYDSLQRSVDNPEFGQPARGYGLRDLVLLVRNAHSAGLKVMVKPHLEMRHYDPTPQEFEILRGKDDVARQQLLARISGMIKTQGWNNMIEMRTEEAWQLWFQNYRRYILDYARQAQEAQAEMFCVGRELDRTVALRDSDWRRIIQEVRSVFHGPLVYSANFDSYPSIRFWDALDFIGISAYFSVSPNGQPTQEQLAAGWDAALGPLEAVSRRFDRPVLFTEVGYPAVEGAGAQPWRETRDPADVWLQARCYQAALRAVASRPWIQGTFWWLWEGSTQPPFRDPSYTIQGKPASFVLADWYRFGTAAGARGDSQKHAAASSPGKP